MSGKHTKKEKSSPIIVLLLVIVLIAGIAIGFFVSNQHSSDSIDNNAQSTPDDTEQGETQVADGSQDASGQENSIVTSVQEYITISTEFGDLCYPEQWSDYLKTNQEVENDSIIVSFSAMIGETEFPMFQVTIGNSEDALVGELTDNSGTKRNVYMSVFEIEPSDMLSDEEQQRLYAMQEDLNYLIDHLA